MRICLVNLGVLGVLSPQHKDQGVGGAEVQCAQLAAALLRLGHDVRLIVADAGQPEGATYEGIVTHKTYKESAGLPALRFVHPRWTKLWAALARADADVYYFSCAGMVLGLLAMFCRIHKRRLVFRVASDYDCEPDKVELRYRRDRWLYQYGLRRADAVLVQSTSQQRALLRNYGRQSSLVGGFVARPLPGSGEKPKDVDVLWVSNIRKVKRPERLLALARSMPDIQFHMAGGEQAGEIDLYKHIAQEARSIPNLHFHGAVAYQDVGSLFDRARVLANTSDLEGFPNTFLQAWVRGIPVVTMFDPDETVRRNGLGSSHTAVPEMVQGIRKLLLSQDAYRAASAAALQLMRQRYGESVVLRPYLDVMLQGKREPETLSTKISD